MSLPKGSLLLDFAIFRNKPNCNLSIFHEFYTEIPPEMSLEYLTEVHKDTLRAIIAKAIIDRNIGAGVLVELSSQAKAGSRRNVLEVIFRPFAKTLRVHEDHSAKQATF